MKTINDYAELVKEKHALNKTIAPVETDLTDASRGYHIGEQFIYDGEIYKAKTEIAQHDALVLNTNYEPSDNLIEQIKNAGGGTGTDPRLDVFENNIAPVETDETDASRAYQVGEQLILNNILYDVIAPISEHDVITTTGSGANIEPADPLSSQFQTLTNNLNDEIETRAKLGAHNLIPFSIWNASTTYRGIVWTVNSDGTINGNGTVESSYVLSSHNPDNNKTLKLAPGTYKLSGCPSGGASDKYCILVYKVSGGNQTLAEDDGEGAEFTLTVEAEVSIRCFIYKANGATNITFEPMIRLASDPSTDYAPYAMTNRELTEKNPMTYKDITITADGTKTFATLLFELYTAVKAYIDATPSNQKFITAYVNMPNIGMVMPDCGYNPIRDMYRGYYFGMLVDSTDGATLRFANIQSNAAQTTAIRQKIGTTGTVTFTDFTSVVPANASSFIARVFRVV